MVTWRQRNLNTTIKPHITRISRLNKIHDTLVYKRKNERADRKVIEENIKSHKNVNEDKRIGDNQVVDDKRIKAAKGSSNIRDYQPDVPLVKYD